MSFTPPPPSNAMQEKVPPAAWLVPVGAALGVVGVFTPWFKPEATYKGDTEAIVKDGLYSFKEGRLGLIAPIFMVVLAIGVVRLIQGHSVARFNRGSRSPVSSAGLGAVIVGVIALAAAAIAYFTLPVFYKFKLPDGSSKSWSDTEDLLKQSGVTDLSQGPQIGFWLTAAGGVVVLVAGILILVTRTKAEPAAPQGVPQGGYAAPQGGYAAPQGGYAAPAQGPAAQGSYPPPAPQGYQSQQGYQQPQQGYQAPQGYQPPAGQ